MDHGKNERTELMNICMIYDDKGNVLMQNRRKKVWPGVTFPGGHVELGESLVLSVIREIKEETGLDIEDVRLCGVKEWFEEDGTRAMVFFTRPVSIPEPSALPEKEKYSGPLLIN